MDVSVYWDTVKVDKSPLCWARKAMDFIVSMAGPGIKGDSIIVEQNKTIMKQNGMTGDMSVKQFREIIKTKETDPWYRHFLDYDPSDDITSTRCPVMAINGSLDMQVMAASNR